MKISWWLLAIAVSLGGVSASTHGETSLEMFGKCLKERGVVMYSAWWCPYCFKQLWDLDPTLRRDDMRNEPLLKERFLFSWNAREENPPAG